MLLRSAFIHAIEGQHPFRNMQMTPKVQRDGMAMQSGAIQPIAYRVFVNLHDTTRGPDGLSFRQSAHRRLKKSWVAFQTIVTNGVSLLQTI